MEPKIDQLAEEMTEFCKTCLVTSSTLPQDLKAAFIRTQGKLLTLPWDDFKKYYPTGMATCVVISLLLGNIQGPWWNGHEWARVY
ncbi:MAG: hypothetical protein Fur0022_02580 [Anaerolineales bacterium]